MKLQHVIEGLVFFGWCSVCLVAFVAYDWWREHHYCEREYRRLVAAQGRERVR